MGIKAYLAKKVVGIIITMWVIATINFFLFQVMPFTLLGINPEQWFVPIVGTQHNLQYIQKIREMVIAQLGFNKPLDIRYFIYLKAMFTFQFGYNVGSVLSGPVISTIARYAPYTVLLLGGSTIVSFFISLYLGVFSAHKRGTTVDQVSFMTLLFFYAMPSFWIGTLLLLIFAYYLKLSPPNAAAYFSSFHGIAYYLAVLKAMILPFTSLTLISIGGFYLIQRSTAIDIINEDFVTVLKAKGLKDRSILYKHVLRNAILPTLTIFAISMGFVLSGAVITETIFGWPGLGYWTYMAIVTQDFPLEQAIFFIISLMVVLANFIADISYGLLDPRIRRG